jgi:carbamoyl-phosphate synthase large subunit
MNLLLTCAGRRDYLVRYFQRVLKPLGGSVCVANSHTNCSSMAAADKAFILPPIHHPGYVETLLRLCEREQINLVISLYDPELPILARSREGFESRGITLVCSRPEAVQFCDDKWQMTQKLLEWGLDTPTSVLGVGAARREIEAGRLRFPLCVKPRRGMASIGVYRVDRIEDLESAQTASIKTMRAWTWVDDASIGEDSVIVQEWLSGSEYLLDVVNNLDCRYVVTLPKRKLSARAGEADSAETVDHPGLDYLGGQLGGRLGHVGVLDVDVLEANDRLYVLDCNCRFGGAYPFSHVAGANVPAAIVAWAQGKEPDPEWLRILPGVRSVKGVDVLVADRPVRHV